MNHLRHGSRSLRWLRWSTRQVQIEYRCAIWMRIRPVNFQPSPTWPRQCPPTKSQKRLWKRFLVSSYLRYIPCWKDPPAAMISTPVDPIPSPTELSSYHEYIQTRLSRTERRLLDGLDQVASDLRVLRAFRSKSCLYIASDGGLGDGTATHGWVISTKKDILFKCSGPVDGPLDTNSSTRSELGRLCIFSSSDFNFSRLLGPPSQMFLSMVLG